MLIENFDDLLDAARAQAVSQQLLFVFATAELPEDASAAQRADFAAGLGGALVPSMCVDKSPDALLSFEALTQEAAQFGDTWRLVFAAALSGTAHSGPDSVAVDAALQAMVESIKRGDVQRYLAFDRQGIPVVLG